VNDEQRAARQLERALECLPLSLVPKVVAALEQRVAMLANATNANGHDPGTTADDAAHG
jgi:hypothetical protein